jgi:hypothetical protein
MILFSCGKDNDLASLVIQPEAVALVFPENLAQCNEGTIVSASQSDVTFQWNASERADSYELHITNLLSSSTDIYATEGTSFTARIERGVPFSWFVVSLIDGSNTTANSNIWSFYNAGDAITSYVPFPAEALNPQSGEALTNVSSITLEWQATDLDNDLIGYDIYFGTTITPDLYLQDLQNPTISGVTVTSNTDYYWHVVSKDSRGNESESNVFFFTIN